MVPKDIRVFDIIIKLLSSNLLPSFPELNDFVFKMASKAHQQLVFFTPVNEGDLIIIFKLVTIELNQNSSTFLMFINQRCFCIPTFTFWCYFLIIFRLCNIFTISVPVERINELVFDVCNVTLHGII